MAVAPEDLARVQEVWPHVASLHLMIEHLKDTEVTIRAKQAKSPQATRRARPASFRSGSQR